MRLCVKALRFFTILFLLSNVSHAQFNSLSLRHSDIISGIQQVIGDYPNQFKNITGELLTQNPQSADYRCTIKIDNAEESYITRYTSSGKVISSWQAQVFTTEDFDQAKRKFKSLYTELNNHLFNGSSLKGTYEAPAEEKKFTNVLFSFATSDEVYKHMKLELVMENVLLEWKIKVLVYAREREDNEKGAAVE